jgi:hypothetical protein
MNLASDCNASPNLYRADHSPVNASVAHPKRSTPQTCSMISFTQALGLM